MWASPASGKSKKHLLAVGCESGVIDIFDAISGHTVATLANSKTMQGHTGSVNDGCFDVAGPSLPSRHLLVLLRSPLNRHLTAGSTLFSASADGSVIKWDMTSKSNVSKFIADK